MARSSICGGLIERVEDEFAAAMMGKGAGEMERTDAWVRRERRDVPAGQKRGEDAPYGQERIYKVWAGKR